MSPRRADPMPETLADAMAWQRERWTETEFIEAIFRYARPLGWRCAHFRTARTAKGWRTAFTGDAGFPDIVLARQGVVVHAEVKRAIRPRETDAEQLAWLDALGGVRWTPAVWPAICAMLETPPGMAPECVPDTLYVVRP